MLMQLLMFLKPRVQRLANWIMEVLGRQVGAVMTRPVITAEPVTDIWRIATAALTHRIDGACQPLAS